MSMLDFDTTLTEWHQDFKYKGVEYVLVEAPGGAVCEYKDAIMRALTLDGNNRPVNISGLQTPELRLLAECIFVKDGRRPVSFEIVSRWSNKVTDQLINMVKEHSDISSGEESVDTLEKKKQLIQSQIDAKRVDAEGNELSSTTTGS